MTRKLETLERRRRAVLHELELCGKSTDDPRVLSQQVNALLDEWHDLDLSIERWKAIAAYDEIQAERRRLNEEYLRQSDETRRLQREEKQQKRQQRAAERQRLADEVKAQKKAREQAALEVEQERKDRKRWRDWRPLPVDVPTQYPIRLVDDLPSEGARIVLNSQIDQMARSTVAHNYASLGFSFGWHSSRRYENYRRP